MVGKKIAKRYGGNYFAWPGDEPFPFDDRAERFHLIYTLPELRMLRLKTNASEGCQMVFLTDEETDEDKVGCAISQPVCFEAEPGAEWPVLRDALRRATKHEDPAPTLMTSFVESEPQPLFASSPGVRGCLLTTLFTMNAGWLLAAVSGNISEVPWGAWVVGGFMLLLLLAVLSPKFNWAARILTGMIFAAYVWYLVHELIENKGLGDLPANRSTPSVLNAFLGLMIWGLPSLWYTIYGGNRNPRRKSKKPGTLEI